MQPSYWSAILLFRLAENAFKVSIGVVLRSGVDQPTYLSLPTHFKVEFVYDYMLHFILTIKKLGHGSQKILDENILC
jgi:hypothetical protein